MPIVFANFMEKGIEPELKRYVEVKEYEKLKKTIGDYMLEETKLNLVLFRDCIEHMSRVSRALMMDRGNLLLVGVGGSGKKALTTMGAALQGCLLDTIEIKKNYQKRDFKDDLFRMMKKAGCDNKPTVFLFNDTQIL